MEADDSRVTLAVLRQTALENGKKIDMLTEKVDAALHVAQERLRSVENRVSRLEVRVDGHSDDIKSLSGRSNALDALVAVGAAVAAFLGLSR